MSSNQDPTRLAAEPGTSGWLRSALSNAQRERPSAESVDKLTVRVEAAVKASSGTMATGKIAILGAGIALGVAVGSVWNAKHTTRSPPTPPTSASSAVLAAPSSSAPVVAPETESAAPPEAGMLTSPLPLPKVSSTRGTNERDAHNSGPSEAALLDEARSSLSNDPRRALSLTQEHARRFPKSVLVQEREVIAIEALARLGQATAAKARAANFARRFPGSAHQQKVDQLVRGQ